MSTGELKNIKNELYNNKNVKSNLTRAKLLLAQLGLVIPKDSDKNDELADLKDILEFGCHYSIRETDISAFESYLNLLKPIWIHFDTQSPDIISLQLLIQLIQNKISDFHTLLETLPIELLNSHEISIPVKLERFIMEGSYSKLFEYKQHLNQWIWDQLLFTIRNQIALSQETAYQSLPINDAATLLYFKNQSELMEFSKQRGWSVSPSTQHLVFKQYNLDDKQIYTIPSKNMISHSLNYAKELESIV